MTTLPNPPPPSPEYSGPTMDLSGIQSISDPQIVEGLGLNSSEMGLSSETAAAALDASDSLAEFRSKFHFPTTPAGPSIYMCGNSLGLQPRNTADAVKAELDAWAKYGVEGHFAGENEHHPWVHYPDLVLPAMAKVVGASESSEVTVMNSLTVNVHLGLIAFYRPTETRNKIIMEGSAFPSDRYAVETHLKAHNIDPQDALVVIHPREGEDTLRTEDIIAKINEAGDSLATVMFSGVHYYTGQCFDMAAITAAGHAVGATVGFDLAHAVGNVQLKLHDWNVDFAMWCSYKYLNSGPGGIAGFFVHKSHHGEDLNRHAGWWAQKMTSRFDMTKSFDPVVGAGGFASSNPPALQTVCLWASLELFMEAGVEKLLNKSRLLTSYLELLVKEMLGPYGVRILTPSDPTARGAQLSLLFEGRELSAVQEALAPKGIIVDLRKPNVMRVAPTPMYNSFVDVHKFVSFVAGVLKSEESS